MIVRDAEPGDVPAIAALQNAFVTSSAIEWTDTEYDVDERQAWFAAQRTVGNPVLVAVTDGDVVGWASYGEFRDTVDGSTSSCCSACSTNHHLLKLRRTVRTLRLDDG